MHKNRIYFIEQCFDLKILYQKSTLKINVLLYNKKQVVNENKNICTYSFLIDADNFYLNNECYLFAIIITYNKNDDHGVNA